MQSFGESGSRQSEDCAFHACELLGVPIRIHYFLVVMFLYQVVGAYNGAGSMPIWFPVLYAIGCQLILFATILTHEFGHGLMARFLGGRIMQILLWPFGGICFSTRPENVIDSRTKLKNDLKIVVAGPSTHFIQGPMWVCVIGMLNHWYGVEEYPVWHMLVPFSYSPVPWQLGGRMFPTLLWMIAAWAVQTNVWLFLFNVFFPMYPLDSAKICVCSLQLCGCSARTAAKFLVYTTVPMAFLLMYYAYSNRFAGFMPAVTAYMGVMCLMEAWKIHQLMEKRQLHTHHLFETARSDTHFDESDGAYRINTQAQDDVPLPRSAPQRPAQQSVQLFGGAGHTLGGPGTAAGPTNEPFPRV